MSRDDAIFRALGVVCGVSAHHGIFIKGEWHTRAPGVLLSHAWAFVSVWILGDYTKDTELGFVFRGLVLMSQGYLPGLFVSIVVYRLLFHRLSKAGFPGPLYARVTKLWHVWACRDSRNHMVLDRLRIKYGDFVRTGKKMSIVYG